MVSLENPQAACSTGVPHGQGLVSRCRQDAGVILQNIAIKEYFHYLQWCSLSCCEDLKQVGPRSVA